MPLLLLLISLLCIYYVLLSNVQASMDGTKQLGVKDLLRAPTR